MPGLTVILPMLDAGEPFENTLASLLRNRPPDCQLVVVHDGKYRDPYGLAGEVEFLPSPGPPHLGEYLHHGTCHATREVVFLIRPGIEVVEGWQADALNHFADPQVGSVCPLIVDAHHLTSAVVCAVTANVGFARLLLTEVQHASSPTTKLPWGPTSWAGFYRRSALWLLQPNAAVLGAAYLDLDLAFGLAALGYRSAISLGSIATVDHPQMILAETTGQDGHHAGRLLRRYGELFGCRPAVRGAVSAMSRFASALIAPRKLGAMWGSLTALKHASQDDRFAAHLRRTRERLSAVGGPDGRRAA